MTKFSCLIAFTSWDIGQYVYCNWTFFIIFKGLLLKLIKFFFRGWESDFNIYHEISGKSNYLIYLLECLLCKIQFIGKLGTPFHIRLNNHRKDIRDPQTIEACKHFNNCNHVFHKHGKFILTEQLSNIKNTSTEVLKQRLKDRENYWIKRLKTLAPFGLNQEIN